MAGGESSDADVRSFGAKSIVGFYEIYGMSERTRRELSQWGHFSWRPLWTAPNSIKCVNFFSKTVQILLEIFDFDLITVKNISFSRSWPELPPPIDFVVGIPVKAIDQKLLVYFGLTNFTRITFWLLGLFHLWYFWNISAAKRFETKCIKIFHLSWGLFSEELVKCSVVLTSIIQNIASDWATIFQHKSV